MGSSQVDTFEALPARRFRVRTSPSVRWCSSSQGERDDIWYNQWRREQSIVSDFLGWIIPHNVVVYTPHPPLSPSLLDTVWCKLSRLVTKKKNEGKMKNRVGDMRWVGQSREKGSAKGRLERH